MIPFLKKLALCPTMPIGPITMQKCEAKHSDANNYSKIVTILSDFAKLCKKFEAKEHRSETLKRNIFFNETKQNFWSETKQN